MNNSVSDIGGVAARAECLVSQQEVERALDRMARDITRELGARDPLVLCVMIGGVVTAGHLLTRLDFPLRLDYVHATRYRGATRGGALHWVYRPTERMDDQHILIVDDILDEGFTLEAIAHACREAGAASVHSAVLVEKQRAHTRDLRADFVGLRLPDRYLCGYGLDYHDYLRNLAGIYAVAQGDV